MRQEQERTRDELIASGKLPESELMDLSLPKIPYVSLYF